MALRLSAFIDVLSAVEEEYGDMQILVLDEEGGREITDYFCYHIESEKIRKYMNEDQFMMILKSKKMNYGELD